MNTQLYSKHGLPWSREEREVLRELYPTTNKHKLAELLHRKPNAIEKQAGVMGLHKIDFYKSIHNLNKKYGRLTVISPTKQRRYGSRFLWICKCDCGNVIEVPLNSVVTSNTLSCGCLKTDRVKERSFKGYMEISGTYWKTIKNHAKQRGRDFNISLEYIWDLFIQQNRKCAISNLDIHLNINSRVQTASLDRINSSSGYIIGNVQWLHKIINKIKNNLSDQDFISYCCTVYNHQNCKYQG